MNMNANNTKTYCEQQGLEVYNSARLRYYSINYKYSQQIGSQLIKKSKSAVLVA